MIIYDFFILLEPQQLSVRSYYHTWVRRSYTFFEKQKIVYKCQKDLKQKKSDSYLLFVEVVAAALQQAMQSARLMQVHGKCLS